jgi:hypothetical protein
MSENPIPSDRRYPVLTTLAHVLQIFAIVILALGVIAGVILSQQYTSAPTRTEYDMPPWAASAALFGPIVSGGLIAGLLWMASEVVLLFVRMAQDQARATAAAEMTASYTSLYLSRAAKAAELTASYIERANAPSESPLETPAEHPSNSL